MKKLVAAALCKLGVSATLLTFLGFACAALSGWLVFQAQWFYASLALLASGLLDLLDGEVARLSGKQSDFGGILDSSLDRYGDACVFAGLTLHFAEQGRIDLSAVTLSAWAAAFLVSYVRARAECVDRPAMAAGRPAGWQGDTCRVGFWERGERIGVLVLAFAVNNPATAVWLLGTAVHWTVFQRLVASRPQTAGFFKTPSRRSTAYYLKIAALAAILLFVRVR